MKKKIVAIIICILMLILVSLYGANSYANINTSWTISQYGDNIGPQMMCFFIEGNKDGLIIVDGGYKDSTEQVEYIKSVIKKHDNKVDAWIITHLDSDHVGAFLNIYENCPEIQIDNIYAPPIPKLNYEKDKNKYDVDWEEYEEFCDLNLTNLTYLYEYDIIENIIGLKLDVLWSFRDSVYDMYYCPQKDVKSYPLFNNGSLIFKLSGKKENILFCSDTQHPNIEKHIVNNHSNVLKSDYLQVGHHGNNNFSKDFYKLVSPKVAFFCAPDWLFNNEYKFDWFTVGKIRKWLENNGVKIYSHKISPNKIILK